MIEDVTGDLKLGHLFKAAGLAPDDVAVTRHTLNPGGLKTRADALGPNLLPYTREQRHNNKLGKTPPRIWLNFLATTGRRARFITAFENHGEVPEERTDIWRFFDLRPSPVFSALTDRLVIEWTPDTVNWAKSGRTASPMVAIEIADPQTEPFPGFDSLLISYDELQAVVADDRYSQWRTALSSACRVDPCPATGFQLVPQLGAAEPQLPHGTVQGRAGERQRVQVHCPGHGEGSFVGGRGGSFQEPNAGGELLPVSDFEVLDLAADGKCR
ncbi:hypothetical protein ABFP37_18930 [Burkholderia sp. RS01]|uniref:hypothetical protein n=1 Tax=Burkholderia sp. RS01 TaxID=3139774 RepID=UPI0032189C6F